MRLLIEPFLLIRNAPQYLGRILAMNDQQPRQEHATHSPETLWVSHAAMAPSPMTGFAADLWQEHAEAEAPLRRGCYYRRSVILTSTATCPVLSTAVPDRPSRRHGRSPVPFAAAPIRVLLEAAPALPWLRAIGQGQSWSLNS